MSLDKFGERFKDGAAIVMFGHGAANNDHRFLGRLELFSEWNLAGHKVQYRLSRSANVVISVRHVSSFTDQTNLEAGVNPASPYPRVHDSGFMSGVGPNQENNVRFVEAGNGRIE